MVFKLCKGLFRGIVDLHVKLGTHSPSELHACNCQNKYGIWIFMLQKKPSGLPWPSHFHNLHILTDSLEQAKLDLIHCCQLH